MVMQATPPRYTSTMRPIDTFARLKLTRRQLLELLLPLAAWLPAPLLLASAAGEVGPAARSLAAFLGLLLPADELSPSASQVGVDASLLEEGRSDREFGRLIELGTGWLDGQAKSQGVEAFHQLAEERQLLIVSIAEHQRARSLPRVFFENMRHRAVGHYYANPRTWPGVGYSGPPQPRGFADHDQPMRPGGDG